MACKLPPNNTINVDCFNGGPTRKLQSGQTPEPYMRVQMYTYPDCLEASWPASCSSSVDFPTPGSPPSITMLPGTSPPPRTRGSSEPGNGSRSWLPAASENQEIHVYKSMPYDLTYLMLLINITVYCGGCKHYIPYSYTA